jgi:GNAT superfamily N-acetyltransferase
MGRLDRSRRSRRTVCEPGLVIDARIRRAAASDAPALARLRWDFKREDHDDAPVQAPDAAFVDACGVWLRERLERGPWLAWVAEVDGLVCGHVFLHVVEKVPDPYPGSAVWGYVTNFYVVPAHRGRGLGRRLLDALHAHARAEGFDTLVVWPSDRSAPLYRRAGFAPPGELLELSFSEEA